MRLTKEQNDRVERIYEERRREDDRLLLARQAELRENVAGYAVLAEKQNRLREELIDALFRSPGRSMTIREQLKQLQQEKKALLAKSGYPEDYGNPQYVCAACRDTGLVDRSGENLPPEPCRCRKKLEFTILYKTSPLWNAVKTQSFEGFREELFGDTPLDELNGKTARENILAHRDRALAYVKEFSRRPGNLLLMGPAGTGKTFLCNCIAGALMKKSVSVLYMTAPEYFDYLAACTFDDEVDGSFAETMDAAELLILDDLGTEQTNRFDRSALQRTVNDRILKGRGTIISTNLGMNAIDERYSERVSSRLYGNYDILQFAGDDIRHTQRMTKTER